MRFFPNFTAAIFGGLIGLITIGIFATFVPEADAQALHGPTLGFVSDTGGTGIRPILGIPGAAMFGDPIAVDTEIRDAVISPGQDYAIATRSNDAQFVVVDLAGTVGAVRDVAGARPGSNGIAISPSGSAAAAYNAESRTVQIISHLPQTPEVGREFDASRIPGSGTVTALSDDGEIALVRFVDDGNTSLWALASSGASWMVSSGDSAAAFFPRSHDAVVTENAGRNIVVITDMDHSRARVPLVSSDNAIAGFLAVSTSEDGRSVFAADAASDTVTIIDLATRNIVIVDCPFRPTGLYRLKGTSVFRLTESSLEPMAIFEADIPRVALIPARPDSGVVQQ